MKRYVLSILLLVATVFAFAQGRSGLQIGLDGGMNMRFGQNIKFSPALGGGLDLRYQFLTSVSQTSEVGLQIGVGIASYGSRLQQTLSFSSDIISYSNQPDGTTLAVPITYNIATDIAYTDRQWRVSLPLRLSMRFSGVAIDLGPTLFFPLNNTYTFSTSSGSVDAYFKDYDVHVLNDPSVGIFPANGYNISGEGGQSNLVLSLSGAIGYEWSFARRGVPRAYSRYASADTEHRLSLQLLIDYPLWHNGSVALPPVSLYANAIPAPQITLPELSSPLTIGIRLAYTLFPSSQRKRYKCACQR